jgi:hypothetical protein
MKYVNDQTDLCETIINSKQSNSAMIKFSVNRDAPTSILNISKELVTRLPSRHMESLLDDVAVKSSDFSNIKRVSEDTVNNLKEDIYRSKEDLKNMFNEWRNRTNLDNYEEFKKTENYKLTSKFIKDTEEQLNNINRYGINYKLNPISSNKFTGKEEKDTISRLAQREADDYSSSHMPTYNKDILDENPDLTNNDVEELKYFDIDAAEKRDGVARLKEPDTNNLLYRSISAGFGFVIGGMELRHKQIVQKFFRRGKIYLILATDSVGIGANMKVKHLYLPSLIKAPEMRKIDTSSLVQLINRAGRTAGSTAFIYCLPEDYDNVRRLFFSNPADAVTAISPIPFGTYKKAKENMTQFNLFNIFMRLFVGDN